ncbi:MAG: hypothetical protein ACRD21_08005 [Vicinamibacteria bacterium]
MEEPQVATPGRRFDQLFTSPQFERLRSRLIRIFARRGCPIPEDLADETLSRVMARLPEIAPAYEGDPAHFVYAVARNVYLEFIRRPRTVHLGKDLDVAEPEEPERPFTEASYDCLEECMAALGPEDQRLIGEYYLYEKGAKIERRKELAGELGMGMNALRIKACRIRQRLQACVLQCLRRSAPPEMENR